MTLTKKLYHARDMGRRAFEHLIAPHFLPSEQRQIMRAYRLAKYGHQSQRREGGQRYFEHVKAVAAMLVIIGVRDANVICAALLHDVIEDTFILFFEDIEEWFGKDVCHPVNMVTKRKGISKRLYFSRLSGDSAPSWLVKCADRTHNMSTLVDGDEQSRAKYLAKKKKQVIETRKHIIPLAEKLAQTPGYEEIGAWFVHQLTGWSDLREQEVHAAAA
ncbi:MAG TPA: HD domain-containing protein [Planktothrix sp.]|jgi:(p)ppGpp synthase/HD superfamily hydrolase